MLVAGVHYHEGGHVGFILLLDNDHDHAGGLQHMKVLAPTGARPRAPAEWAAPPVVRTPPMPFAQRGLSSTKLLCACFSLIIWLVSLDSGSMAMLNSTDGVGVARVCHPAIS